MKRRTHPGVAKATWQEFQKGAEREMNGGNNQTWENKMSQTWSQTFVFRLKGSIE